jgi:ABC-type phosphate/phosphonate transport system substrate-binding protein
MIFSPLIYDSLIGSSANKQFYQWIQEKEPELFSSQIDSYESFHTNWTSPKLGLGHICGSSFTQEYSEYVTVLGVPIFSAKGCEGKYYRSAFIIHRKYANLRNLEDVIDHFPDISLAINSFGSNSGWFLPLATLALYCKERNLPSLPIAKLIQTGSHNGNVLSILTEEAHLSAVDCVSLELMSRYYPELLKDVKIIGWTEKSVTPPFVTSKFHSAELKKRIQKVLYDAVSENEQFMHVQSRQEMLLSGILLNDLNESAVDISNEYFEIINFHKALIQQYFPNYLEKLKPGRLLRQHLTVQPSFPGFPVVQVISKGRFDDEHWPKADFHFQNYLKSYLYIFLYENIIEFLLAQSLTIQTVQLGDVQKAVRNIVKKEIWGPLPYGGKCKIILCSLQGIIHLLRVSGKNITIPVSSFWQLPSSSLRVTSQWKDKIFEFIEIIYSTFVNPQNSRPELNSTIYFSGFMGCASVHVSEYFDTVQETNHHDHTKESPSLISELWAIDLALSEKLIEIGEEIGIYAYISAPRHNDRYDWGNLVIGYSEESIQKWRDSISHSSARKYIAPKSYEHIRLHRGLLKCGLFHPESIQLLQTLFLEPKEIPNSSSSPEGKEEYDRLFQQYLARHPSQPTNSESNLPAASQHAPPLLNELNRLFLSQPAIMNSNGNNFHSYNPSKTNYYFKRRIVQWNREDILSNSALDGVQDEGTLIPNVEGSLPVNFYSDILEMKLV